MASEIIALVDTETTGIDPKKDLVIEASWALVHVETAKVLELSSRCFRSTTNAAESINGIPVALLSEAGESEPVELDGRVTAIVAHNADFDAQWCVFRPLSTPWLDTRDWRWPRCSSDSKLVEIALAHGLGVTSAHRAYTDVLLMAALLERVHEMGFPLAEQLAYARLPRATYQALVPFEQKDLAKAAGFRWEPERKRWVRRMLPEDAASLSFKVREVQP